MTAQLLDDMALDGWGFFLAVLLFTVVQVMAEPFFRQAAIKNVPALLGSTALLATLVSLVITTVLSDGLRIRGAGTWLLATVLVWGIALLARLLLPLVIFKKVLAARAEARAANS